MSRLLCTLLIVSGCGDTTRYTNGSSPKPLDGALTYLDRASSSLVIVDPNGEAGPAAGRRLHRVTAGESPVWARSVPRPDEPGRNQVLVSDPGAGQFLLFRDKSGTVDALSVGVPLEAVDVSADGRYGIAYQPDNASPSRTLFAFPNTIAVLDLMPGSPRATALQLGTGGARPLAASFSEELSLVRNVGGTDELRSARVALVFVPGGLIPVDVEEVEAAPFVPMTPDGDREVVPSEVLFTNNHGDELRGDVDGIERAFVRTNQGELFVLAISMTGSGASPLAVALENVVTPDAMVTDIELFFDEDGRSILLAAAYDELILVDGFSGVAERFAAPTPVDALARFVDPQTGEALSLAYSRSNPELRLLRIDPLQLMERRSTAIETLQLGSRVEDVEIGAAGGRAILRYDTNRDLGILDLRRGGDVLDIRFARTVKTRALVDRGSSLLLVTDDPETDKPFLAEVVLGDSFGSQQVELDDDGAEVGVVGDMIYVDHGSDTGDVTFFPRDSLTREDAIAFHGIFLSRLLDQEAPEEEED